MKKPNFFIIGAPKCGTTSLAKWLAEHPRVFVTVPKEPKYFDVDFKSPVRPGSEQEYQHLFKRADERHICVGEATVNYLQSSEAVPGILKYCPDAKFVVCLRNPVEMAPSLHSQFVKNGMETQCVFEKAWKLQDARQRGEAVPFTCHDHKYLLYGHTCMIGYQMERLFNWVSRDRVLVILLEEMKFDPEHEYRRVLEFLGINNDGRDDFPVVNAREIPQFSKLTQVLQAASSLKWRLGIRQGTGVGRILARWNNRPGISAQVPLEMKKKLVVYFKKDVQKLGSVLERDFSHWLE